MDLVTGRHLTCARGLVSVRNPTRRYDVNRQTFLPVLLGLVLAVGSRSTAGDAKPPPKSAHGHDAHFAECANACHDCALSCEACGSHCVTLVAEGKREHLKTLKTCQDCATICHAAAAITGRA